MPKQLFQRQAPVPRNNNQTKTGKGYGQPDFGRKKGKGPKPEKPVAAKSDTAKAPSGS